MGHRARSSVPLVFALLLGGCVDGANLESFELSGRVTVLLESGDSGTGIADARVTFISDTLIVEEAITDGEGRYRMRIATDHPFGQVRAEAEGFVTQEETVYFDTSQRRVDIAMRARPGT